MDGNSAIGSISDTFVFNDGPNDVVYALNVYRLSAVTLDGFNTFQELLLAGSSLTREKEFKAYILKGRLAVQRWRKQGPARQRCTTTIWSARQTARILAE